LLLLLFDESYEKAFNLGGKVVLDSLAAMLAATVFSNSF